MFDDHNPVKKIPDNTKVGITLSLNQNEDDEPFETTVYFKKGGKTPDEPRGEKAIVLTASGKLRLDIGNNGFVEIFAERSNMLSDGSADESVDGIDEEDSDV